MSIRVFKTTFSGLQTVMLLVVVLVTVTLLIRAMDPVPNVFVAGTPAVADEVNLNFQQIVAQHNAEIEALETQIDDNEARITTLEGTQVVFEQSALSFVIDLEFQSVLAIAIDAPSAGTVHIIGNASFNIGASACNAALLGIAAEPTGPPLNFTARVDTCDFDLGSTLAATTQFVTGVPQGLQTFYLVARRQIDTGGIIEVSRMQMTVTFIPE